MQHHAGLPTPCAQANNGTAEHLSVDQRFSSNPDGKDLGTVTPRHPGTSHETLLRSSYAPIDSSDRSQVTFSFLLIGCLQARSRQARSEAIKHSLEAACTCLADALHTTEFDFKIMRGCQTCLKTCSKYPKDMNVNASRQTHTRARTPTNTPAPTHPHTHTNCCTCESQPRDRVQSVSLLAQPRCRTRERRDARNHHQGRSCV
jgi:hypothetical protein